MLYGGAFVLFGFHFYTLGELFFNGLRLVPWAKFGSWVSNLFSERLFCSGFSFCLHSGRICYGGQMFMGVYLWAGRFHDCNTKKLPTVG
jgi:hypothetical protein